MKGEGGTMAAALERLAEGQERLAAALREQAAVMELMVEAVPAARAARLLGVSERTMRRRRKARKLARLAGS